MSIQAMAWVLEHSRSEGADRLVLLAIANHADATGGLSWPSVELIAREARVSRRSVFRSLDALRALGELEVSSGGGRGQTNRYQLVTWKRCQDDTLTSETVTSGPETVTSATLNGATGGTQNRQEPKATACRVCGKPTTEHQGRCDSCGQRGRERPWWVPVHDEPMTPEERAALLAKIRGRRGST